MAKVKLGSRKLLLSILSTPHQTIPEVHFPAAFRLGHGDAGSEAVEETAAVLRVLLRHNQTGTTERDEVLEGTVETLADVPGQSGGGEGLTVGEDLEKPPTCGISKGSIDGIRRNHLRRRGGKCRRRGWLRHAPILPHPSLLTSMTTPQST